MTGLDAILATATENLLDRPSGPLGFRFLVQPLMALLLATRDGVRDGRTGAPPYFKTILIPSDRQGPALKEGIKATSRVILFAFVLDMAYQVFVLKTFHPGAALIIGFCLSFVPYTIVRGPVSRLSATYYRSKNEHN